MKDLDIPHVMQEMQTQTDWQIVILTYRLNWLRGLSSEKQQTNSTASRSTVPNWTELNWTELPQSKIDGIPDIWHHPLEPPITGLGLMYQIPSEMSINMHLTAPGAQGTPTENLSCIECYSYAWGAWD